MEEAIEFFQAKKPPGAAAFRDAVAYFGAENISEAIGALNYAPFPWHDWFFRRSNAPARSNKIQKALEPVFALAPRAWTPTPTICNLLVIALYGKNTPVILQLLKELKRGRGQRKRDILNDLEDKDVYPHHFCDFEKLWNDC